MKLGIQALKSTKEKGPATKKMNKLGPLLALVVLVVFVTIMNPNFLAPANLLNLLRQVSTNALIAFGMTFVIITGGIDLSVGRRRRQILRQLAHGRRNRRHG